MLCPSCKKNVNKVIDSRVTEGGAAIRRRRLCTACERRFTTKERLEDELRLTVVKSSGHRVPYNRDNFVNGVASACTKIDISDDDLKRLVDDVESDLFSGHEREVETSQIGRYVGDHLRRLNTVAYVRFMSVHRKYRTIDEFVDEIRDVRDSAVRDDPSQQSLF